MKSELSIRAEARRRIRALRSNPYPGRGFVIGRTPDGSRIVQVYWLMGRSENSRNRRLELDAANAGMVRTTPIDSDTVTNPELIIYPAMREEDDMYVVSNGRQTDTVFNMARHRVGDFRDSMREWNHEPDAPNYTPRITGIYLRRERRAKPVAIISVLSQTSLGDCVRAFYEYDELPCGYGYCVHTYAYNGNPLPAFKEQPYLVPIPEEKPKDVSAFFWKHLNVENCVALATKFITVSTGKSEVHLLNRF